MKKTISLLLALVMALSLCACGNGTGGQTSQPPAQSNAPADPGAYEVTEPITITWWHALEDQYSADVERIVKGFNDSQDLITVEAQYIGAYKDVNEALVSAHAAGSGLPAVCVANTDYVAQYGAKGGERIGLQATQTKS